MITAVVGAGGKTTLVKKLAQNYREQGKTVLVTTSTHMFAEEDTLLTDDPAVILRALEERGCVMAGLPDGIKLKPLSPETYAAACARADAVLVEADGSRMLPLKFPNATEPVIPDNADEIIVVCGLNALGQPARQVCHRLELVKACLGIGDEQIITREHILKLVTEGYFKPLRAKYPEKSITLAPRHDGSPLQIAVAQWLRQQADRLLGTSSEERW